MLIREQHPLALERDQVRGVARIDEIWPQPIPHHHQKDSSVGVRSSPAGYRYQGTDPDSSRRWPPMPAIFQTLATRAARDAGYPDFQPDACLVNLYEPGAKLSLHQDRDERDLASPIVSVSLGLPAVFLFGGLRRNDKPRRIRLEDGDVVVWGGPTRLAFHGVDTLADGSHPLTGRARFNLTFRRAGGTP